MSIKTTLTNPPTIALIQIIGGLLILASIVGFRSGGMLWPMLGSAAGTGLLILGWERTREKLAALQEDQLTSNRETAESRDRRQLDLFAGRNEITSEYLPGVWEDHEGTLHFDIAALLQHLNLLDTPENRAAIKKNFEQRSKRDPPRKNPKLHGVWHDAGGLSPTNNVIYAGSSGASPAQFGRAAFDNRSCEIGKPDMI